MSRQKMIGIALWLGAVIAIVGGWFIMHADHVKTGIGFIVLGVVAIAAGLISFFSRSSAEDEQLDQELV